LARQRAAEPNFHETVTVPSFDRPQGIRLLITEQGAMETLIRFFDVPRHRAKSHAWQRKVARAVGLLYDYSVAVPPPKDPRGKRFYLSDFVHALTAGTTAADGFDNTGLCWSPMSWSGVAEVLSYVNQFADFCSKELDTGALNPETAATFAERIAAYRRLDIRNEHSLLKHLGNAKANYKMHMSREVVAPKAPRVPSTRPPFFPRESFPQLLTEGFRTRRHGVFWEQYHLRDMMISLLERHGGLRASEPFHLFVTDVQEDRRNPGCAEVRLYHPELGRFSYKDPLSGKIVHVTRREFLQTHYQRLPRNLISGKEHAGWKDLMLDYDKPHYYATVRWFPQYMGQVFWKLYQFYVRYLLPSGLEHPYLFVNLSRGKWWGAPYQLDTYHKNLFAAIQRIGLEVNKQLGTTSHGLRHAYGQDLTTAKIDDKIIQICMHHKSPTSQRVYTRPELNTVHRELSAASKRLSDGDLNGTMAKLPFLDPNTPL
jgi:hypothetical protein